MADHETNAPTKSSTRKILNAVLISDSALSAFCLDHFSEVYRSFTSGMNHEEKQTALLERISTAEILNALLEDHAEAVEMHRKLLRQDVYRQVAMETPPDDDLRRWRVEAYRDLWKRMEPLAKYGRPELLNLEASQRLLTSLRQWYFEVGGMFLSELTRDSYFALKRSLKLIIDDPSYSDDPKRELDEQIQNSLTEQGSALRTSMTIDIGTRKNR